MVNTVVNQKGCVVSNKAGVLHRITPTIGKSVSTKCKHKFARGGARANMPGKYTGHLCCGGERKYGQHDLPLSKCLVCGTQVAICNLCRRPLRPVVEDEWQKFLDEISEEAIDALLNQTGA